MMGTESGLRMEDESLILSEEVIRPQLLQLRDFRPFKTCDEYLWAMKEDLSDWLNRLYPELKITAQTFMECLETGVTLCKHANNVRRACLTWQDAGKKLPKCWGRDWKLPNTEVIYNANARRETFFARDNVHNFITWCRKLGIFDCLLFESDDLILRKNEKSVILCLLEVARRGSHFGMAAPLLVQFEKEIDRDIAKDSGQDLSSSGEEEDSCSYVEHGPHPQIILNDLRSLDEMVRELVEQCNCPTQFPMIRVAEGKYRIGNTKLMIYVRILRKHVMVRVGGGWTTLGAFLARHDPCRHKTTLSSKLTLKNDGCAPRMKVEYERRDHQPFEPVAHSTPSYQSSKKQLDSSDSSSEISDEGYKTSDNIKAQMETPKRPSIFEGPNGHNNNNKKTGVQRAWSTDDERPDSRSTDDEFCQYGDGAPENGKAIMKAPLMNNLSKPSGVLRSSTQEAITVINYSPMRSRSTIACDLRTARNNQRVQSAGGHKRTSSIGSTTSNTTTSSIGQTPSRIVRSAEPVRARAHARSLSAGGSDEFYKYRNSSAPRQIRQLNTRNVQTVRSGSATPRISPSPSIIGDTGKNTWSGGNVKPKARPNVLQSGFYSPFKNRSSGPPNLKSNIGESEENLDSPDASGYPDLAAWIKQVLELSGDQDKIAHIEKAIREFEVRQERNSELKQTSLPYSCNSDSIGGGVAEARNCSSPLTPSTPIIRKRKETGTTKIPRPNFY